MQKIVPHLWFDSQAKEAAEFYVSVFGHGSSVTHVSQLENTPSGTVDLVGFELLGYTFAAISAGPLFVPNPSVSFMVNFDPSQDREAKARLDEVWAKLLEGGKALMPLQAYPFSEHYGWVQDKFGISWQLIFTKPEGEERPLIIPSMLFVGDVCGKAEEATDDYLALFKDSKRGTIMRYAPRQEPEKEGTVMFTDFKLEGQWFVAMDSAQKHNFAFNEAISFIVNCETQEEIDYYWQLSAVPESEQCGWFKDKYGFSWQIVPAGMNKMLASGEKEKIARVTEAFLKMKKISLVGLERAAEG